MKLSTVILAAGLGTRMKSTTPKVLHKIYGKPIIQYVADSVKPLKAEHTIIVVGPESSGIRNVLEGYPVTFAVQKEAKGTGDALKTAVKKIDGFGSDPDNTLLVLSGDTPLISTATIKNFMKLHRTRKEDVSIISFIAEGPHAYGRIVREGSSVKAIVENKDANEEQKRIKEVNSGIYLLRSHAVDLLKEIKINKAKGEYYLTDIVDIAVNKGYRVNAHILGNETELTGINTRKDLCMAGLYLRDAIVSEWMDKGVSFLDSSSVFVHPHAKIGLDTVIYPNVFIEGNSVIGNSCVIYPNTRIVNSSIGHNAVIKDSTVIESSIIKNNAQVGPFAHIRPDSVIGSSAKIGNFVEIKKSVIGKGTKASHLSYLGDAEIGENVNIGAGTITCNYDGKKKHKTIIEDNVFIGSDTQLVAPVSVGKGAYVGAGSTITKDVPSMSLGISRAEQRNLEKWALRKLSGHSSKNTDNKSERDKGENTE